MKTAKLDLRDIQNKQIERGCVAEDHEGSHQEGTFTVMSLFCGCGGLDLGFQGDFEYRGSEYRRLPFDIVSAYDLDKKSIETYIKNIGRHAEQLDLSSYDATKLKQADVLLGGFPCQDYANCGPRRGMESQRGKLYRSLIKYMKAHSPKVVVGENVPGLASLSNGKYLKKIERDLASTGYKVKTWTLFAPEYGVPQKRTRLFIVCVKDELPGFPSEPEATCRDTFRTTRWAIGDLAHIVDESIPNQSQYFKAAKAKRGHGQGDETSKADEPAYTIRANAKSRVQFHYSLRRRLTIRECARLQTFPDDFDFPHAATTNLMQIGNAVPPVLAHIVATSVANFLNQ